MSEIHDAFEAIYRETFSILSKYLLFRVVQPADMEDLLQNVYTAYFKVMVKHKSIENPIAYLTEIANNELKRYYRWKSKAPVTSLDDDTQDWVSELTDGEDPHISAIRKASLDDLTRLLKRMDVESQRILIAKVQLEMTFTEIALIMDLNENTVKARYYRALLKLRKEVEALG